MEPAKLPASAAALRVEGCSAGGEELHRGRPALPKRGRRWNLSWGSTGVALSAGSGAIGPEAHTPLGGLSMEQLFRQRFGCRARRQGARSRPEDDAGRDHLSRRLCGGVGDLFSHRRLHPGLHAEFLTFATDGGAVAKANCKLVGCRSRAVQPHRPGCAPSRRRSSTREKDVEVIFP